MSESTFPPTIIVVHPRERRSKCTVEPLRGRAGFVFLRFPENPRDILDGYVRLGIGGPLLSETDARSGLLVLDGTWRLAKRMEKSYSDVPVRSLPPVRTVYPRNSKMFVDPATGLATIEALYVAHRVLGRDTSGLLDHYCWVESFLQINSFHESGQPVT